MRTWTLVLLAAAAAAACGGRADPDGDLDADGDADEDRDADAEVDGDLAPCGDPEVAARLDECRGADDQTSCEDAGGRWGPVGLYPEPVCQCPTGQQACPCTRRTECLSACIAEPTDGVFGCDGVVEGRCSPVSMTMGCHCFFDDDGTVEGLCVD